MTEVKRLRRSVKYKTLKNKVKNHSELKCYYCGEKLTKRKCTVDHLIPLGRGGKHEIQNLRICCKKCNEEKGKLTDEEYRRLKGLPTPPPFLYIPEEWESKPEVLEKKEFVFDNMLPIDDIKIPWLFLQSSIRKGKLERAMRYYNLYNSIDRVIKVDDTNTIFDGYIGYVVAKAMGLKEIPVVYEEMPSREKFILC